MSLRSIMRARIARLARRVDYVGGKRSTYVLTTSAVRSSAGKKDSIDSSLAVISTAVPKVETVLMKASSPSGLASRNGTAMSWPAFARGVGTRVGAQLVEQRPERGVAAHRDLALEALEHVRAPLAQVGDPRCDAVRMEAHAQDVERRLEQLGRDARRQQRHRAVGGQHLPGAVDDKRRVGLVPREDQGERVADRRHLRVVERVLLVDRRVTGRQQQPVALAQRHFEPAGEVQHHLGARS